MYAFYNKSILFKIYYKCEVNFATRFFFSSCEVMSNEIFMAIEKKYFLDPLATGQ